MENGRYSDGEKSADGTVLAAGLLLAPERPSALTGRFASAVRAAMLTLRAPGSPQTPSRSRTASAGFGLGGGFGSNQGPLGSLKGSRLAAVGPKLRSLTATHELAAHQALVRHLQFSPDGKWLATSSWDRTSVVFRVGDPFQQWRVLAHPQGFVGQVAWYTILSYFIYQMAQRPFSYIGPLMASC
jgi:WD repeat-containing protein 26